MKTQKIMLAGNGGKTTIKFANQKDQQDAEIAALRFAEWLIANTSWPYCEELSRQLVKMIREE